MYLDDDIDNIDNIDNIKEKYRKYVRTMLPEPPPAIFDHSDIVKIYGKKFEYLDDVMDGSDLKKEIKPGYTVVNAVVISKNMQQPIHSS